MKNSIEFSEKEGGFYWGNIYWGKNKKVAEFDAKKFKEFINQSPEEIKQACYKEGRLNHIIRAEHFDLSFLETICETARAARKVAKLEDKSIKKLLSSKSVLNFFAQPSQRTFLSFSLAEAHLGMRREEVRDIRTSSFSKGESEKDSLRTISSYFDALVCRNPSDIYDLFAVWVMKNSDREIPVINAGSGKREHPTQGILDYYTVRESFKGELEGRTFVYVGDCARGRTVHSLAKIMALHKGTEAYFIAPEELQIDEETEKYIVERGTKVFKETKPLKELINLADVVYMTRIQDEHGGEGEYNQDYVFSLEMLELMKEGSILMHPMPKRDEIDPRIDYLKKHPKVMYWRQQRNGMWARVALLAYVFGVDEQIRKHYQRMKV